ncbi:MAG: hypothetical protein V4513_01680 [Pseudomonadota bacterium]
MQLARPAIALDPKRFGRGRALVLAAPAPPASLGGLSDDLRLFATTFLAGFIFVSVFLA